MTALKESPGGGQISGSPSKSGGPGGCLFTGAPGFSSLWLCALGEPRCMRMSSGSSQALGAGGDLGIMLFPCHCHIWGN